MWLYTEFPITFNDDPGTGQGVVNLDQTVSIDPTPTDDTNTTWVLIATLADGSTRQLLGSWSSPDDAFDAARGAMLLGPGILNANAITTVNAS